MNMYEAILKTADAIEAHPERYNFQVTRIPSDARGSACMLGRLAQICGIKSLQHPGIFSADDIPRYLLGIDVSEFFRRITTECYSRNNNDWQYVVPALRRYADLYRAELEPRANKPALPGVRLIFNPPAFVNMFCAVTSTETAPKGCYNVNSDSYELMPTALCVT